MRSTLLIAWREYKQYIFSRGFLIFLVLFPLGIIFGGATVAYLESAKPARTFAVYDETGVYAPLIAGELEERRARAEVEMWDLYVSAALGEAADDLPEPFRPAAVTYGRTDAYFSAGGATAANAAASALLDAPLPAFSPPRGQFEQIDLPEDVAAASSMDEAAERLRPYLLGEAKAGGRELFAAIIIPAEFGADADAEAQYWSTNLTDPALRLTVARALESALRQRRATADGVPDDTLRALRDIEAPIAQYRPDRVEGDAELSFRDNVESALPAVLTYMLLVIVFGVGNLLLTNTIEERSNKIVEVLLSSVTAEELMMGKLIGIAAVGLTMPAIFLIGGGAATAFAISESELLRDVFGALFSSHLLLVYFFYFFCAYFIFAMIFLAIGAVSNSLQDAQSYMGPIMLFVFAPLPFLPMVFQNPNGLIATVLTWIPIYTPYAVMLRASANPPLMEVLGATALMLAFGLVLARYMGRIFKNALLQAAPPKARELWRLAKKDGV